MKDYLGVIVLAAIVILAFAAIILGFASGFFSLSASPTPTPTP